jgi:hypothetical protein
MRDYNLARASRDMRALHFKRGGVGASRGCHRTVSLARFTSDEWMLSKVMERGVAFGLAWSFSLAHVAKYWPADADVWRHHFAGTRCGEVRSNKSFEHQRESENMEEEAAGNAHSGGLASPEGRHVE